MSATPEQIAERLEKHPLYFWSGSSEPEYQHSDLPAEAAALIRAQSERERVLVEALREIDSMSPAKEPRNWSTVGAHRNWSEETRDFVDQILNEAFDQGHARGSWEQGSIARAALKAAP